MYSSADVHTGVQFVCCEQAFRVRYGGASVVHLSQRGPRCIGGGASVITSRRRLTAAAAAAVFVLEWAAAARGASQNGSR